MEKIYTQADQAVFAIMQLANMKIITAIQGIAAIARIQDLKLTEVNLQEIFDYVKGVEA